MTDKIKKKIAILGSTGSIGIQALDVVRANNDTFEIEVLTANNNVELLINQALEFKPNAVVIGEETHYKDLNDVLFQHGIKVYAGKKAIEDIVEMSSIDIVLTAMVGFAGLIPTINAIRNKKTIALANKETLVVAGEVVIEEAKINNVNILPVDSEHSAIFQCLSGEWHNEIEKIYLTASGGPFRLLSKEALEFVTKNEALKHPNWAMGNKITIDSASMMNKGLEMIEAKWLFNLKPEQIDVIIHPQSIVHSIVQFEDGSMKAQMGLPDMKLPIQYALSYPYRINSKNERFDFLKYPNLTFEKVNKDKFPSINFAVEAMTKSGNMPCIMNAANEIAVDAFLNEKIKFTKIFSIIEQCMSKIAFIEKPDIETYIKTDKETRIFAKTLI
ncbi:MAG: 1-deoxy-D-xylulose-5-phosphate reductoisomerase [Bacteroidetes bacterium GWE2_29_8]|nr:MAG: 1-deoxy-D-xylulose-5-phosphate reductoisomerase [Bacteroidetes bacterium GWE2_29_8]OFY17711.1 MAG: 1-deoxy-D-xylulose-5-phosphate reductoisomerase [Bacteroidetes bacterium GWF2_29_10]